MTSSATGAHVSSIFIYLPTTAARGDERGYVRGSCVGARKGVRRGLSAGRKWIRTIGPPPEIVVDPSGSRRDHRAKYGCLSAKPRVRCLGPPGKTQHLLPKSVFDRPGSDRRNLASTTFPDARPMVRIRFPPAESRWRTDTRSPASPMAAWWMDQ